MAGVHGSEWGGRAPARAGAIPPDETTESRWLMTSPPDTADPEPADSPNHASSAELADAALAPSRVNVAAFPALAR